MINSGWPALCAAWEAGSVAERREDLRAADSDRQFVAERLRAALNEGRLDLSEYDERLQTAYAAKTYGELDHILDDLPAVAAAEKSQVAPATPTAAGPSGARRLGMAPWLLAIWGSWLTTGLVLVVVWLMSGAGSPWPLWVIGPWGALLLARTVTAHASGDPQGFVARQSGADSRRDRYRDRREERWQRRHDRRR
jgi:hypothetical protein